jgi:hypothetical protein
MWTLFSEWIGVLAAVWNEGDRLLRWGIGIAISWPVVVALAAILGMPAFTAVVTLLPLAGGAVLLIGFFDPMIPAMVAAFPHGRQLLRWIAAIIQVELAFGVYLSIVPVSNRPRYVPLVLLACPTLFSSAQAGFRARRNDGR